MNIYKIKVEDFRLDGVGVRSCIQRARDFNSRLVKLRRVEREKIGGEGRAWRRGVEVLKETRS